MNIIDFIDQANPVRYSAPEGQRFIIPRLKGVTQIIAGKAHPDALAHYLLAYEVVTSPANTDDMLMEKPQLIDGVWTTVWSPRVYTLAEKKKRIKNRRDEAIYSGVTVEGLPIDTDEVTQGRLAGAALAAVIDDTYTANWKVAGKFVTLSAQQIISIAQAVRSHVQACFDREAALLSLTDQNGDPREPVLDEIDAGWPA